MRRLGPLLAALISLTFVGCEDLRDSAARVEVRTSDFRPGCVRLVVTDAEDASREQVIVLDPPANRSASWVVAVYRGRGWSRSLQIDAVIHEQGCDGNEVDRERAQVTLTRNEISQLTLSLTAADGDGDGFAALASGGTDCDDVSALVHPNAVELCDGVDQNCNGTIDEGLGVGELCGGNGTCPGLTVCGPGGLRCEVPPPNTFYPDRDGDGRGATDGGTLIVCGAFGPDAGMAPTADDCDDSRDDVYAGAPERCDGVDNSCDGQTDELFAVGTRCAITGETCSGILLCAADGGTFCKAQEPLALYRDEDFDGRGAGDPIGTSCNGPDAGESVFADDCNDANRTVFTGAMEVCDLVDNDCDVAVDEGGVCTSIPAFVDRSSGGGAHDWLAVHAWQDGGTGVFIVGAGDRIRANAPGGPIGDRNGACVNTNWEGVWVDPRTSLGYLAGRGANLAKHPAQTNTCVVTDAGVALEPLSSITGYEQPGGVLLFAVAENGRSVVWDGGTAVRELPAIGSAPCLEDVHGISPEVQFAVGGTNCTSSASTPVIYRWNPLTESWTPNAVPAGFTTGKFTSVFVVHPRLAYAVGTTGSAGLIAIWQGAGWAAHSIPSGANLLTGVIASGPESLAVSGDTSVWVYNGAWYPVGSDTDPLWDLHASWSDDIWVVGDNGSIRHFPD